MSHFRQFFYLPAATFSVCLALSPSLSSAAFASDGIIPFDSRWDFANYVTWRPANDRPAILNPPRFSWPAVPTLLPLESMGAKGNPVFPKYEYIFQLSQNPEFPAGKETIEKRTNINFENAFPILAEGTWYWRVGYANPDEQPNQWGAIRTFTITPGIPAIDRTPINRAVTDLAKLSRPRLGPPDGDWAALRKRLETDTFTAPIVAQILSRAEAITTKDWWKKFPKNDTGDGAKGKAIRSKLCTDFADIGRDLTIAVLAYKLTGDERYKHAYDLALQAAAFPPGGETSPEYNGSTAKWGTRWIPYLAYIYDLGWHDYTPEQREQIKEGLRWRINAVFNKAASWRTPDGRPYITGMAGFTQSHPYENSQVAMQGVLLLAGELPLADELTPVVLNYLLGVGTGHGPDGAWNEAGAYTFFKSKMMFDAALVANKLLPELRISEHPWFTEVGNFLIQLAPPGMRRQGFGDYTRDMDGPERKGNLAYTLQRVVALNDSPSARLTLNGMTTAGYDAAIYDNPLPLVAAYAGNTPRTSSPAAEAALPSAKIFTEPGWFFVSNKSPSDWASAKEAIRLVTMARPRGGYSHSYSHDGAFVWQAFGTTLSAGGGIATYGDAYSRNGFSHNGILVNGRGASFRNLFSENPISARPLFWKHDTDTDTTLWAGDMTGAFLVSPETEENKSNAPYLKGLPADRGAPGLQRWIRHYALLHGRDAVIVDDLAMRADVDPARFTWLFHIPQVVPVKNDGTVGLRARYTIDDTEATVNQFSSVPLEIKNLRGLETLKNPLTGTDYGPSVKNNLKGRDKSLDLSLISGEVIAATTSPVREVRFITVLTARPKDGEQSAEVAIAPEAVTITRSGKTTRVVLDAPEGSPDINIPVTALRHFVEASDPFRLPPAGTMEKLSLPTAESTEVEWLRRDDFSDAAWVNRWWVETENALVRAIPDQGLNIKNDPRDPEKSGGTTAWMRADVPERLVVRIRATTGPEKQNNACNLNLILRANQADGTPLIFGTRTGDYPQLHQEPNYIVTFTGGYKPGWSRVRRDPGFVQTAESKIRSEPGQTYDLVYIFDGGRLRMWINGQLVHDWTDPQPLPNGKLGLRTWHSDIQIHSVEVGRLSPAPDAPRQEVKADR